jgi:hypothetical protein
VYSEQFRSRIGNRPFEFSAALPNVLVHGLHSQYQCHTSREGVRDSVSVAIVTFMSSFTTDKTNQWLLNYHFWGFLAVEDALCNMTATWEAHPPYVIAVHLSQRRSLSKIAPMHQNTCLYGSGSIGVTAASAFMVVSDFTIGSRCLILLPQ